MIARSSTASFENVKIMVVCIMLGARAMSMRTLRCHSPLFSSTEGVFRVKLPAANAGAARNITSSAARTGRRARTARARREERGWAVVRGECEDGDGYGRLMSAQRYIESVGECDGMRLLASP